VSSEERPTGPAWDFENRCGPPMTRQRAERALAYWRAARARDAAGAPPSPDPGAGGLGQRGGE